jgi:hypothetical protein
VRPGKRARRELSWDLLFLQASHLATGAADFWFDDSTAWDSPAQKAGSRGSAHTSKALARVHSLCDGPYTAEDVRPGYNTANAPLIIKHLRTSTRTGFCHALQVNSVPFSH